MASSIKVLDVVLPHESAERGAILHDVVWPVLKPEWNTLDVLEKKLTAGYVNCMSVYHTADDTEKKDALIVRVNRIHDPLAGKRRDLEFIKMQIAEHMGCYPAIRAVLKNGVIYQYAPGRNLTADDFTNPTIIRKVARALAQFNWFDPTSLSLIDRQGVPTDFHVEDVYMPFSKENYAKRFTGHPEDTEEEKKSRQATHDGMGEQLEFLEEYLHDLNLPIANAHTDFHNNNILYDDNTGRVTILDFEFSRSGNIATYDFSYMFNMYLFRQYVEKMDLGTESVSDETKRQWMRAYLERKCELEGRDVSSLSDTEVDLWMVYLAIADPLVFFYGAVRCLPHLGLKLDLPVKEMYEMNLRLYYERKHTLVPLKERCLQLRSQLSQA